MLTPTKLKLLCEKYHLVPSKKYGQNFLINEKPVRIMIEAAELTKDDTVVEIGPGFGVLTLSVALLVKKVMAFEIERKIEGYWEEIKGNNGNNIEIIWGDALNKFKVESLKFKSDYKVLANLPYSVTSNALRILLEAENKPSLIIVMVQKEVAERICAKKGEMSLLALSVQYYGTPKIICRVSKGSFWPEPSVDSAVLMIRLNAKSKDPHLTSPYEGDEDTERFFKFAKAGFANKRKQLWRNLAVGLNLEGEKVKQILQVVMGNEKVRAEELGVEEWKKIIYDLSRFSYGGKSRILDSAP